MKMKFILFLLLLTKIVFSQDITVEEILKKSDNKLKNINTLTYWVDFEMKYLSNSDTTRHRGICHLKSVPKDSMKLYHNVIDLSTNRQQLYNGENIVNLSLRDSSTLIINTELYGYGFITGNYIKGLIRYDFFQDSLFLKKLADTSLIETKLGNSIFHGEDCFSVEFKYHDDGEVTSIRSKYYFRQTDFFPIGFSQTLKFQNMTQYKEYRLSNVSMNPNLSDNLFDLDYNIIHKDKIKNYIPKKREELLSKGENVPRILKETIRGDKFDLDDYKGKIVILDFWYRSCYPCIKALPDLQKISENFNLSEIVVVGVNTFDKKDKIVQFLNDRNITYMNIFDAKNVALDYKVSAYPTLYIIDKEGKVASSHIGWSDDFYEKITNEIREIKK